MSEKSYLQNQIKLVSLNSKDMFTNEEYEKYEKIISCVNEIDKLDHSDSVEDAIKKKELVVKKKQLAIELTNLIRQHKGVPRKVRLESVIFHKPDTETPDGVTWWNLKISKKIAEFESDMSRAMGLQTNDHTFDKIIVTWGTKQSRQTDDTKYDLLEQLVKDGFTMDLLEGDRIIQKKYRYFSSSAGQLRTDKLQFISEDMWNKVRKRIECGMDWDTINSRGGINISKYLAYLSLACSASIPWPEFDIDRCIVIPDYEGEVTDRMLYIKPDYTVEDCIRTVIIDHVDGSGMYDPESTIVPQDLLGKNFMVRGPYHKGLLSPFAFLEFCRVHNVKPVIKDVWGLEHDLVAENIQIIFTKSQFKLAGLFQSHEEFKKAFKECGAQFVIAQFDEDWPPDKTMNYQFIQALEDFTDEEIQQFVEKSHEKILNLTKDKDAMLKTLKANKNACAKDKVALALYPELLRDGYSRQQLKDTKKRMLYDAKSGTIKCKNKRLYVIPDFYAACEKWFLGIENPLGLLEKDEVACKQYISYDKIDILRSPSLYMEHSVNRVCKKPEVYKWFTTDGIYTSVKSLISRILQFDQRSN